MENINKDNAQKTTVEEIKKEVDSLKSESDNSKTDELIQRLSTMEDLMRQQIDQNKKLNKSRSIMSGLMAALVLVVAIGMYQLNATVVKTTDELPELMETASDSMEQLESTLEDVSSIDFENLNDAISEMEDGLADVDFEKLNQSIEDLQVVVERMRSFLDFFG